MKTAFTTIIGILIVIVIGWYCQQAHTAPQPPSKAIATPEQQIMSIRELQTALNAQGHSRYKCEIDGKWGPETAKALDNFICDRQAIKEFE